MGHDSVRIVVSDLGLPVNFLLVCEADDIGNWKLPGGKLEVDESPEDAAIRELKEELGIEITKEELGIRKTLLNDDNVSKRHIFCISRLAHRVKPSDEIADVLWVKRLATPECKNKNHILSALDAVGL